MAARGSESKNIITAKLLETFAGSFIYDKNVIIPMVENGESLQIKIALTCAKTNVESGMDNAIPGAEIAALKAEIEAMKKKAEKPAKEGKSGKPAKGNKSDKDEKPKEE